MSETRSKGLDRGDLLLLLLYLGMTVGTTYPLVNHLTTHLPGRTTDTLVHYWNGWWVRQALISGRSPFFTPYLFYPQGLSLVYHNFAWLTITGWLALEPILGGFAAYNVVLLLSLALCGWAASHLVYELLGDRQIAFLSGLIYQCWPYRMAQLDHPNLISTCFIPLFLLFLDRTIRLPRWRSGVLTGVFFALVGYTRWQLLIPASIVGAIYLAFAAPRAWAARHQWMAPLLLAGGVAVVALAPPAALLLDEQDVNPASLVKASDESALQTDLMAYLTPSGNHPVLGTFTRTAYDRYYAERSAGRRFPAYVGVMTLVLAVFGVWRAPKKSFPWLVMVVTLVVLALGTDLRINGRLYPTVPMPYRVASKSFIVRLLRFPDRFSLFVALPMSVLAGHGALYILRKVRRRGKGLAILVLCLISLIISFEYLTIPVACREPQTSVFYEEMADKPGGTAVLNLPLGPQESKRYMFAQVRHQHPILQGKTARLPEGTYAYVDKHPLLRSLRQSGEITPALTDVGRQLSSLADDGVAHVLLHKQAADPERLARWRRYLLTTPRFEDDEVAVFSTSPVAERDFSFVEKLSPDLGIIEVVSSTRCLDPGGVLEVDVGWGTTGALEEDLSLELALTSGDGLTVASQTYPVSSKWPSHSWPANAVAWGYYPLHAGPSLSPGLHELKLTLVHTETGERYGQMMDVGNVRVPTERCSFPIPSDATAVNAVFGDVLRLLGYTSHRQGEELTITLFWRSERRMEIDYKIFVHVFDRANDTPAAQDDAMPQRWRYPTTLWGPGERVIDEIPISLEGVPKGDYGVAVGVYNPQTIERLPATDTEGQTHAEGRLVLPEGTIHVEGRES